PPQSWPWPPCRHPVRHPAVPSLFNKSSPLSCGGESTTRPRPAVPCRPMSTAMQEPARIRGMFASIARTYDPLNHLLSLNQDKGWRRFTVAAVGARPGDRVLDVCTGTADLAIELSNAVGPTGSVVGTDFCEEMVRLGLPKAAADAKAPVSLGVADTLRLPFRDGSFRAVT